MSPRRPSSPRKPRGAPPGNLNAIKHGFYSKQFRKNDLADLELTDFTGLLDEIKLLRVYIRRVVELGRDTNDLAEALTILRVLCLASASLNRLLKTQRLLVEPADETSDMIQQALHEIAIEMELKRAENESAAAPPQPSSFGGTFESN
jgi:hypothetical protein